MGQHCTRDANKAREMINEYVKRKVGPRDSQPCTICSKLTATVLFNSSAHDWFYCCDLHLQDNPQFVTPIYPKEYSNALEKLKVLKQQLDHREQIAKSSGNWDSWVSKFLSRNDNKSKENVEEVEGSGEKQADAKETNDTQERLHASIQQEYDTNLDLVTKYQNNQRKFSLNKIMFEGRIERKKRQQILKQQKLKEQESYTNTDPDQLLQKFSFPSVPKP